MKLAEKTLAVLKSFASINPSIILDKGSVLRTISPSKTVLAKATVPNDFEHEFAIYALSRFLGAVSLLTDPVLEFEDTHVTISDGKGKSTRYTKSDETVIVTAPKVNGEYKVIALPSTDVEFKLTEGNLKEVIKASGVLGLPDVAVVGDGKKVSLQALDSKNPSGDVYSIALDPSKLVFKAIFKVDNLLKLMPGSYDVGISAKGISQFTAPGIEYFVAVEQNSLFGKDK